VGRRLVLDLDDVRPLFALPAEVVARTRAALGPGWEVVVVEAPVLGTGDGGPSASPAALEAVREAEVYMGVGIPPDLLRAGPGLRWIHSAAAGVRASLTPELRTRDLVFTNSAGIHAHPIAETVLGYLLHFARGLDVAVAAQRRGEWDASALHGANSPVRELGRSTVGVVGLGGIGGEVARRALALGARVLATRRRPERGDGAGRGLAGVELLTGDDALDLLLGASDYVVLTLPDTATTRGLIGPRELGRMRPDAVLVNVSRGRLVDEAALVEALKASRLRGAALDVFATEPLPPGHPFWSCPNLLITPHTSGYSHAFWEREAELIEENVRRYLAGQPLRNVVDQDAGY
jgi:phosphoglycerate dehydrogenase-like enzyme